MPIDRTDVVWETSLPGLTPRRGKVRDVYDLGEQLLFVTTDRISAFDWVMPNGIPDKGCVLNRLSQFWFAKLGVPDHRLPWSACQRAEEFATHIPRFFERSMLVRPAEVVPVECVVRGYLAGSGWKEYQRDGKVTGIALPAGLREADRLPEPIFTPATKATSGHDINIPFEEMCALVGSELARDLRQRSLDLYLRGAAWAEQQGLILADTKFEWGIIDGQIVLVDEVLTPDSSRYWPADEYEPGRSPPSFDKQFVRDWLESSGWDKSSPPPALPEEIVQRTRGKYIEAYERITAESFEKRKSS